MSVKIILLDLDGTLLNSEKTLPEENRQALIRAADKGVLVVPATGRFYMGIPQIIRELPFVRYALCVNGAQLYDAQTDTTLHREEIPLSLAMRVFDRLDQLPVIYDCYLDGAGYISRDFYAQIDRYIADPIINRMIRGMRTQVDDFRGYLTQRGQSLQKIVMFFADMQARARALQTLPEEFPELAVTSAIPNNIEMNIAAATKGNGLLALCRRLGIDPADAMALGDGSNDAAMLRAAGLGVAMANADPVTLAAADWVTASNDQCGVAMAIERFVL